MKLPFLECILPSPCRGGRCGCDSPPPLGATTSAEADGCLCPDLKLGDMGACGAQVLQGEAG